VAGKVASYRPDNGLLRRDIVVIHS
jgi:hypothetical protein